MDNKNVFAKNLKKYMEQSGKSRKEICNDLGFSYFTFSDWVTGKKYPRMDRVEKLANYFGILKSDLIEESQPDVPEFEPDHLELIDLYSKLTKEQKQTVMNLLRSFVS